MVETLIIIIAFVVQLSIYDSQELPEVATENVKNINLPLTS